ncbi:hypothetical protein ACF05L_38660 [Streptomyces bobili]|uniref:hypothetical protein n=1 Tax=Streptomyces bobili TaxID=67280 RepID=UPI0036F6466A
MRAGWVGLWRWTAWAGIGLSLYAGWLTADDMRDRASSERDIGAACVGLISGSEVMDLQGGMVRAQTGGYYDGFDLDGSEPHGSCTVYKVPGPGRSTGLLTLVVRGSSDSEPLNWIGDDSSLEPFSRNGDQDDVTAVADRLPQSRPIGDGTLGRYGNGYTTIRAVCGTGSRATAPKLLNVTARADYDEVSAADRERIAHIARSAAEKAAARIGCRTGLPDLPVQLAPVSPALSPAKTADGTCKWFARHLQERGQGRLPDRALAVPAPDTNPSEGCLLAVSPDQVGRIAESLNGDQRNYARTALTHSPWWLRSASYFGPEAHTVGYDDLAAQSVMIKAGTAGRANGAWWASSVCNGEPALHTLSASYPYNDVLGSQTVSALFRAYVDDITKGRGCTQVTFPGAEDFRNP